MVWPWAVLAKGLAGNYMRCLSDSLAMG
jgi:hypothetical protein